MIDIDELQVHFGRFIAVDRLSLSAAPGRIFGFLGSNRERYREPARCGQATRSQDRDRPRGHLVAEDRHGRHGMTLEFATDSDAV